MRSFLFFLFLFSAVAITAQTHFPERVVNAQTHRPVGQVLVYLPELNIQVQTDSSGYFTLPSTTVGVSRKTAAQFSCSGYKTFVKTIFTGSTTPGEILLEPGGREIEEVVVYGTQTAADDETANNIESVSSQSMRQHGALSIADGVTHIPGVSKLSTGAGISKPVIRGLYGNRIQNIFLGMRFDNQQWQDEHGLGLMDMGVDRVEVIKGPAALLYGSEAMGGVLNIIEEKPAPVDSLRADFSTRFFSNTYGAAIDGGVKKSAAHSSWRIRLGAESHADYSEGGGTRVLNSRFDGKAAKATYTFSRNNWVSVNNYMFAFNRFGFIFDENNPPVPDDRISRDFSQPHHEVFINAFTSQNTFFCKKGLIKWVLGAHINRREEQEGSGGISLDMLLGTYSSNFQYILPIGTHTEWTNGIALQYQTNKNLGWRTIVPDAQLAEASAYSYIKSTHQKIFFEGGARFDLRNVTTYLTGTLNPPGTEIQPFDNFYNAVNGSAGIGWKPAESWLFKANATSGYRTGNLAELASNGVHEGTLRYEIGDPNMKVEQNLCGDFSITYAHKGFRFDVSVWNNRFLNYIYLAPTSEDFYGFSVYRYRQANATLQGGEAGIDWVPQAAEWLDVTLTASTIRAQKDDGSYLPFIPSDRFEGNIKCELGDMKHLHDWYVRGGAQYVPEQNRPAQFETETPAYTLVDAGFGFSIPFSKNRSMQLDICCNNLLDAKYYDHLSRYKAFGIYDMGRNICLNFYCPF